MTAIEICNLALASFGHRNRITSLDTAVDTSAEALRCSELYDLARQTVLRAHAWRWALAVEDLEEETGEDPLAGYAYVFADPEGLRILDIQDANGASVAYTRANGLIYTKTAELVVRYIFDEDDTAVFDVDFTRALVARLAADLVLPITGNTKLKQAMEEAARLALARATCLNAGETSQPDVSENRYAEARQ